MTTFFSNVRVMPAVFGAMFGLFAVGCETDISSTDSETDSETASETASVMTVPASTNTTGAVLNDDPHCKLALKYRNRNITNVGQVHYLNRVLTCEPFDSANPVCVQYNDTQRGEVTLWKNLSNKGTRIATLPSDRGIDIIVVWYE